MPKAPGIPKEIAEYIESYALDDEAKESLRQKVQGAANLNLAISTDEIDAMVDEIMAMRAAEQETSSAVSLVMEGGMTNEELRTIDLAKARELSVGAGDAGELGTGFKKVEDKRQLIGQGFLILEYRFFEGQKGLFAAAFLMTDDGRKLLLTDGSKGIRAQLEEWTKAHDGKMTRMVCRNGLRMSGYLVCSSCDKVRNESEETCPQCGASDAKKAATFYLDENA